MNNHTSNRSSFFAALGLIALVASAASASSLTSADGTTPKPGGVTDPLENLPFGDRFDPDQIFDPTIKDDVPSIPIGYVDIPEIDREPDGDGDITPHSSEPVHYPDDLIEPLDLTPNPFLIVPGMFGESTDFEFTSPDFGTIVRPIASVNVPVPGTALIGVLASGALLRRRR